MYTRPWTAQSRAHDTRGRIRGVSKKNKKKIELFLAVSKLYYECGTIVKRSFRPNYRRRVDDGIFRQGCWNGVIGREERFVVESFMQVEFELCFVYVFWNVMECSFC